MADADALRSAIAAFVPDVAIIDIRMPPTHTDEGLRAAIDIRRDHPDVGVLVFSQYVETRYATRLLADRPNGVGYLLKDRVADVADFVDALTRVASGGTALDPEVVGHLMRAGQDTAGVASLTPREREVLSLMAEGRSNAGIAAALVITPGVVEKHVANIFAKLVCRPRIATTAGSWPSYATSVAASRLAPVFERGVRWGDGSCSSTLDARPRGGAHPRPARRPDPPSPADPRRVGRPPAGLGRRLRGGAGNAARRHRLARGAAADVRPARSTCRGCCAGTTATSRSRTRCSPPPARR